MKKLISLLLCVIMTCAIFVPVVTAEDTEKPGYVIAETCDSDSGFTNHASGAQLIIDTENKFEGEAAIKVDMPETYSKNGNFCMMVKANFDPVSINDYPLVEVMMHFDRDIPAGGNGIQINCVDTDVAQDDGWNTNYAINGKSAGWNRLTCNTASCRDEKPGSDKDHITRLRISHLCYNEYVDYTFTIDSIIFITEDFRSERAAAETALQDKITEFVEPTAENIETTEASVIALMDEYKQNKAAYPNFMIGNQSKYDRIVAAYYNLRKGDFEAKAEETIAAIGEVTHENYTEKLAAIEAAEAEVKVLSDMFGEDFTLDNMDVLTAARKAHDDFVAADDVIKDISKLPAVEEVELVNKFPITEARKAYNALTEDQKALVAPEILAVLEALEKKIYELENPYTLGNVDEDEEDKITASDALLALQAAVKKIELSDLQNKAAEVDGKEGITAGDALCILQYAVGKITSFPIEQAE